MNRITGLIESISKPRFEEDSVDRLNYKVTTYLALGAALTIFSKEYWGDPIQCWTNAEFPNAWVQYTRDICFVENTYYVPIERDLPEKSADRASKTLGYYQWVPSSSCSKRFATTLPTSSGACSTGAQAFSSEPLLRWRTRRRSKRKKTRRTTSRQSPATCITSFSRTSSSCSTVLPSSFWLVGRGPKETNGIQFQRSTDSYLTLLYILTKILFILNNSLQFFFMAMFIGGGNYYWGWEVTKTTVNGLSWRDTGLFPRVTMCDFQVQHNRRTVQTYSVQCVLSANMLNEKLFVFIWWWTAFLQVTNFSNLFYWIALVSFKGNREQFVKDLLITGKYRQELDEDEYLAGLEDFVDVYLKRDGILLFRLMVNNAGEIVSSEVMAQLFKKYKHWRDKFDFQEAVEGIEGEKMPMDYENSTLNSFVSL
ncbi:hypothetical protein L596_008115 [Steinernema carpocapsae]|uniref:Innexin n=1 Tax=Steinernema carpocapsae TaxID=34508 RepID=A0A4V6A677_STECR|nr:hypothetical protein L596_008115 [Steinernema carpocapsae]